MFLFEFWVFSARKCEAVIFTKFGSDSVHHRPLEYLDVLVLLRAHAHAVEKLQFSFILISCCPEILNSLGSLVSFLKIACLHVSFTAYENFYKLSKMYCLLILFSTFIRSIREQKSNNQTYIHLYTDFIIHKYICDGSLSGDHFHIVNPF